MPEEASREPGLDLSPGAPRGADIPGYAQRIAKCREYLARADSGGGEGFRALARLEFIETLGALPAEPDLHIALIELATRTGAITEMRDIYFRQPAFRDFADPMLKALQAVEISGALPHEITVSKHFADWNNVGRLAQFSADALEKILRRYVGLRWSKPLIVGVLTLISVYFWWGLIEGIAALWNY